MTEKPLITSDALAALRGFLEQSPELEKHLGRIAHFVVVLDANMAVGDLLHKAKNPGVKQTKIEEITKSSVITLYAPTWLDKEMMSSTIPQAAKKGKVSEERLFALWADYKQIIVWNDNYTIPEQTAFRGDEKDIPYVALQKSLKAAAILSRDSDIEKLGGKRVDFEFIIHAQQYARSKAISVGLKIRGVFVGNIAVNLFIQILRGLGSLAGRLPDWTKLTVLILAGIAVVHPKSRAWIMDCLHGLGGLFASAWPEIEKLIDEASTNQVEADAALVEAEKLLS